MTTRIDLPIITTSETHYVKQALRILNAIPGVRAERQNTGAVAVGGRFIRFGNKGNLDIAGSIDGMDMEVEIKVPDHRTAKGRIVRPRPTVDQYLRMNEINRAGGYAWWTSTPDDLPGLISLIRNGFKPFITIEGEPEFAPDRDEWDWWQPSEAQLRAMTKGRKGKKARVKR